MFHTIYNGLYKAIMRRKLGDELNELLSEPEDTTHLRFAREDEYGLLDTSNIQMPSYVPPVQFPTRSSETIRIQIMKPVLDSLRAKIPVKIDNYISQ